MSRILITGGNRGLGLQFVEQYARAGHSVIAACREPHEASALHTLTEDPKLDVRIIQLSADDDNSIADAVGAVRDNGEGLDMLINNAGVGGKDGDYAHCDRFQFLRVLDTNTVGPMMVTRAFHPLLRQGKEKLVVNVTSFLGSIASRLEYPGGDWVNYPYNVSKAALNMLSVMLAHDLKPDGIRVLMMHPGWVATDMGGPEAPLKPAESVAGMIRVIAGYKAPRTAEFLDYKGDRLPW